ncbi:MAG: PTS sugar transporter subunit IIA [Elusimicrobia bacterium]|nr:PTS sugar transporter subunit IIA [Elusimicrobiota bacterium]
MINVLVITHGEFGAYLVEAAEGIVGRQDRGVRVVATSPRQSIAEIQKRVSRALAELDDGDGVLLFTDMPGGTPNNVAFPLVKDAPRVEMVSGVNLYMLVSAFSQRGRMTLDRLVEKVVADGQKSVRDVRRMFLAAAEAR